MQHFICHRFAFLLVTIEQGSVAITLKVERQFPAKVEGIGQAGVHALGAQRALYMGRIAGQEHPVATVVMGQSPLHGKAADPARLTQVRRLAKNRRQPIGKGLQAQFAFPGLIPGHDQSPPRW